MTAMTLIETKTLVSAAASIEFTDIPQDGTDLLIYSSCRSAGTGVFVEVILRPNGATTNGSFRRLFGNGSAVGSNTGSNIIGGVATGTSATSNTFANSSCYVPNYAGSTNKSMSSDTVTENNATEAHAWLVANLWSNTAAITSLTFVLVDSNNFAAGSTISLYKITKGTDGITSVS